jgi:hypothetical protein
MWQARIGFLLSFLFAFLQPNFASANIIADGKLGLICVERYLCGNYSQSAQDCATAGSYENCMTVKLGGDAYGVSRAMCNTDGTLSTSEFNRLSQLGVENDIISADDYQCYPTYLDLKAAKTIGYRPQVYESMNAFLSSLDWNKTPYLYGTILIMIGQAQ